jgi:hypothetical protein
MVLTWRQLGLEHLQKQNLVSITYLASFCLWFRKHCAYLAAAWPWASRRAESIQRRISSVILSLVSKTQCLPGGSLALSISKATMLMMRIQMGESRSSGSFYVNKGNF